MMAVEAGLLRKAEHDRRMQALDSFLATYEAEHGVITEVEIDEAVRRARSGAAGRAVKQRSPACCAASRCGRSTRN
jgi:hypothetical protein